MHKAQRDFSDRHHVGLCFVILKGNRRRWRPRMAALFTVAGAALLTLVTAQPLASADSQIVIHGADSGSHLRITTQGSNIIVNGYMSPEQPTGCRFTQFRTVAVCPTADVGQILIEMGPSDDKVEILDPMPLPVTAYLGNGSDKFIGNNEPDTCYPQGARRNRCYGGGGNDICITGPRNSDCVGDGGDDYCKTSTGSDGCWGDYSPKPDDPRQGPPGNDVCHMGPGQDGCHGGPGNDVLYGGSSSDKLYGGPGNDRLYGGGGADKLYGGPGFDYCDGQGPVGKSYNCEAGPGH